MKSGHKSLIESRLFFARLTAKFVCDRNAFLVKWPRYDATMSDKVRSLFRSRSPWAFTKHTLVFDDDNKGVGIMGTSACWNAPVSICGGFSGIL